jgi:hypothetical protein
MNAEESTAEVLSEIPWGNRIDPRDGTGMDWSHWLDQCHGSLRSSSNCIEIELSVTVAIEMLVSLRKTAWILILGTTACTSYTQTPRMNCL